VLEIARGRACHDALHARAEPIDGIGIIGAADAVQHSKQRREMRTGRMSDGTDPVWTDAKSRGP
jgi:hypothetical protein